MVHVDGKRVGADDDPQERRRLDARRRRGVKALSPTLHGRVPKALKIELLADQSMFVRAAVDGVLHEAVIAAGLTALMILLFLGSWRSTLIVVDLDPAVDPGLDRDALRARPDAQRDDARRPGARGRHPGRRRDGRDREHPPQHRRTERPLVRAILDGAQQIAVPAFVSTLCICIVFVPVVPPDRRRAVPVRAAREAVVFAMLDVVLPVAHARADDGAVPARRPRAHGGDIEATKGSRQSRRAHPPGGSSARSTGSRTATAAARVGARAPRPLRAGLSCVLRAGVARARAVGRARLLPDRRRRR